MNSPLPNPRTTEFSRFLNITNRFWRRLPEEHTALLPETHRLIARLRECPSASQLDRFTGAYCPGVVSYRAETETGRPCIRFNIVEADAPLLSFLRQPSAPFEVLQLACSGLQYHWRSDLAKILENQAPMVGQMSMLTDRLDIVVDHIAIPVLGAGGISKIRGWFTFSHSISDEGLDFDWSDIAIVRRAQRSRHISLPPRLLRPEPATTASRFWWRRADAPAGSVATPPPAGAATRA